MFSVKRRLKLTQPIKLLVPYYTNIDLNFNLSGILGNILNSINVYINRVLKINNLSNRILRISLI